MAAAIDWLSRAFGFEEQPRFAEGDGVVYLRHPGPDYRSPKRTGTSEDWGAKPS